MTPATALTAVVARLNAVPGLVECVSSNGLLDGGSLRLDRGFAVKPNGLKFLAKNRNASRADGARVDQGFIIQIGHVLTPTAGQSSPTTALTDLDTVIRYLWTPDTSLTSGGGAAIYMGNVQSLYQAGGEYMIHQLEIRLHYNLPLTPP